MKTRHMKTRQATELVDCRNLATHNDTATSPDPLMGSVELLSVFPGLWQLLENKDDRTTGCRNVADSFRSAASIAPRSSWTLAQGADKAALSNNPGRAGRPDAWRHPRPVRGAGAGTRQDQVGGHTPAGQVPEVRQTISLRFFRGRTLTTLRAGLALNVVSSPVNGLMPLRALVAGLC